MSSDKKLVRTQVPGASAPTAPAEALEDERAYRQWLGELKGRFRQVQLKAAVTVNTALLQFYWDLGADVAEKQKQAAWGSGFLAQLSADLMREFPEMAGFSKRNLELIRQWHTYWQTSGPAIAQQPVSQLLAIPWGHNLANSALPKARRGELPSIERKLGMDGEGGV